jgi:AcrR family transcriptional regulator
MAHQPAREEEASRERSTRDALLDAAARVVSRGEALGVASVAAEAKVSRGTVYRHFEDRDGLVAALRESGRVDQPLPETPDARERLLDAFAVVLKRQGIAATTLEEVARQAGVGSVTVYRRFGDRRGLLEAFFTERTPRRLVSQALKGTGQRDEDLFLLARESLVFVREYGAIFINVLTADAETKSLFASLRVGPHTVRATMAKVIDRWFPDPTGRTVLAFQGLMMFVAWSASGPPDDDARFIVDTFLRGVDR